MPEPAARTRPVPLRWRLDDAQRLHRPRLHALHVRADVDVLQVELPGRVRRVEVPLPALHDRLLRGTQDDGRPDAGRVREEFRLVAVEVEVDERHLAVRATGHADGEEARLVDRERVGVLAREEARRVEVLLTARVDAVAVGRRPRAQHGLLAVHAARAVDEPQRAPRTVVAAPEDRDRLRGVAAHGARVDHAARAGGVVAPPDSVARAVGVARPESLRVAEVAVHVLPPVVEDAPVWQDGGVSLEERGDANLVDVRAVRLHAVEVAHDVAVAHAVLGVARG